MTAALVAFAPLVARGQATAPRAALILPTSRLADQQRLAQLAGDTTGLSAYLLRSPSRELDWNATGPDSARRALFLLPRVQLVTNSATPFSMNDGPLWAGRGGNLRLTGGVALRAGPLHVLLAPEFDLSGNAQFDFNVHRPNYYTYYLPPVPFDRYGQGYANPWYVRPYSADVPWRMGKKPLARLVPGQSGVWVGARGVEFGATTENMWWGPGIQNAIVMSDNAAGVPRLELRAAHPIATRFGTIDWRWFTGALKESPWFDTTSTNNIRSLAAAAVTWRPSFQPTLTLGVTRAVYATATGYGQAATRWLDIFARTGPVGVPLGDSTLTPGGKEQLLSLFARWVFPADGFEAYTEWARQEFPRSLHDFLAAPTYSHGYTLGLQWRRPAPITESALRIQAEVTTLEQSSSFRSQPMGVFYTSRRVIQGYTELGQPIGAAIGPGASSQWIAIERVGPTSNFGVTFQRIRWNEDVRSTFNWPAYLGYCNHDVSILPGIRVGHALGGGYLSGVISTGNRLNTWFQNNSGCQGPGKVDTHNTSVSITFSPFGR